MEEEQTKQYYSYQIISNNNMHARIYRLEIVSLSETSNGV
jgi:hypothetical protein